MKDNKLGIRRYMNHLKVEKHLKGVDEDQQKIYLTLLSQVYKNMKGISHGQDSPYYYRWRVTNHLAKEMDRDNRWLRYRLNQMEEAGLVEVRRGSNYCLWSPVVIPGYRKHEFDDYIEPVENNAEM